MIINTYPHAPNAFTQGLVFHDGLLYEGTGLLGQSTIRKVNLGTGRILRFYWLPSQYFGEGITIFNDRLIQLTWKSHKGFVYDREDFKLIREFSYPTEGWGITHNGKHLIMSDGTDVLYFLDPETFRRVDHIEVKAGDTPVKGLNELEYIKGEIFANVWPTWRIARICPVSGRVNGWIDLKGILDPKDSPSPIDVLNGIAYDAENGRLFVTGKLWPRLFEIELVPKE